MITLSRTAAIALGSFALAFAGHLPISAQEPVVRPIARKKADPARRVPDYFGQIGLTTEQRASIYGVQEKHLTKIEALEKQIEAHKAEMLAECEGVLSETQKKLLENLRRASVASPKPIESAKAGK